MFTECPECSTAFRVTAKVLQQAGGRVRCGGCGNAFSAIDHLTEDVPGSDNSGATPAGASGDELTADDKFAETSKQLLETLDELAGPEDVRIEDTGIEWRVMNADEEGDQSEALEASQESLDLEEGTQVSPEERRYDDNTPLLDDVDDEKEYESTPPPVPPQRRASDLEDQETSEFDEKQADLALSEPEDWADLLDEVSEGGTAADDLPLEVEEELAAIHNELSAREDPAPVDLDSQFEMQAEAMGLEISGVHDTADDESDDEEFAAEAEIVESEKEVAAKAAPTEVEEKAAAQLESTGEFEAQIDEAARALLGEDDEADGEEIAAKAAPTEVDEDAIEMTLDEVIELSLAGDGEEIAAKAAPTEAAVPEPTAEELTVDMQIDQELMAAADKDKDFAATLAGLDDPSKLFDVDSPDVETIIMEGEFVRGAVEEERLRAEKEARSRFENADSLVDTYAANRGMRGGRRSTDPAAYGVIVGSILLALLLAGQVIHAYRETLSTYGLFNQTLGPVYRLLGNPVTPEWDVKGWRFEATNGNVAEDEDVLTIFSRIGNNSQLPLPYPLVHVSLTDRWEEIIGSRVLEPNEYLAGDLDPSRPVIPGDNFTAVITIDEPSADATGFKLNVCYRVSPGRVRCATEDFKN